MALPIIWHEPQEFAAGDTLSFEKSLPDFPAPAWSLKYEMRGGSQLIEFTSVPDGASHSVTVAAAVTANWLPGDYTLTGYALSGAERHQIYLANITVTENTPAAPGDEPQKTFAQQMLENLEAVLLAKSKGDLLESSVENSRFRYLSLEEVRKEHGYWKLVRAQEIKLQRAKMGLPTGNKIRSQTKITGFGPSLGSGAWPFA